MAKKVVYDSSDEEQVKRAQEQDKDFDRDLHFILSAERGRRWLYTLIYDTCHVDRASFVPGDPEATTFNEGGRAIGLALREYIRDKDFSKFMQMHAENHGEE